MYLRELIEQSRTRVTESAPYFLLWGVLWVVGYLLPLAAPPAVADWTWPVIYVVGGVGSAWIGVRSGQHSPTPALLKKLGALALIIFLGGLAIAALFFGSFNSATANAFFPLLVGLVYMAAGVFLGREFVGIGALLVAASVAGTYLAPPVQNVWFAAAGGGGLILTGILLRRQVR